jgi:glycosyltransferase involved in cell wall biosynthesis
LFCGLWSDRRFFFLILYAQIIGLKTGLIMESYSNVKYSYFGKNKLLKDFIKAKIRPIAYRISGILLAKKINIIFAISNKAVEQYCAAGFERKKIFKFGYFVPPYTLQTSNHCFVKNSNQLKLIFIGSLIEIKGIHTLIQAMKLCSYSKCNVILDIFGPGFPPEIESLPNGVNYKGVIPFGKSQETVANYDALVLPSLYDGWGVVVNEALLQGVPVILSDAVGAGALIEKSKAGWIFPVKDFKKLSSIIICLAKKRCHLIESKSAAYNFKKNLYPAVAARYFYECLLYISGEKTERPISPWYR